MDARPRTDNPLGLNLDFLYGRGYLWAKDEQVGQWVTLERLRMEIPDLSFPFDVRGGLQRFRHTRCLIQEVDLAVDEAGIADRFGKLGASLDGFHDLDLRFLDGVVLVSGRVTAFGDDTFFTFRLAPMPSSPNQSDDIEVVAYDARAYGPLPCPVRQLVNVLLEQLVKVTTLGTDTTSSYAVQLVGNVLRMRPLKLVLLHVFARYGWKLPNLSGVEVGDVICKPGGAHLRARGPQENWERDSSTGNSSQHLTDALAAEEARALFQDGDRAVFGGRLDQALRVYHAYASRYQANEELVDRMLDVLLSMPEAANLAEAESLIRDLEAIKPASLVVARGRARLAEVRRDPEACRNAYGELADLLDERGETVDRALCEVIAARYEDDASVSAKRLGSALRAESRSRPALLGLRDLYRKLGRDADLEDVLKRLTGVATDDDTLVEAYVELAEHLMSKGEIAEARSFLGRALRLAPDDVSVLDAMGRSWVLNDDPARAVKLLGDAAAATQRDSPTHAARLLHRVARLWRDELENREQALLQVRRALDLLDEADDSSDRTELLLDAADLCESAGDRGAAIAYWTDALALLESAEARSHGDRRVQVRRTLSATLRRIAEAYRARGRNDVAAAHDRRLIEMDPTDVDTVEALETHYREHDGLERFARLLRDAVDAIGSNPESLELRQRLAERYMELGQLDHAAGVLEQTLTVAPGSERVRKTLAELLRSRGQLDRLRRVLETVLDRVQQRDARWAIAMQLCEVHEELDDPNAALRMPSLATDLLPARPEPYATLRERLENRAGTDGWDGPSPLGGTIGSDLVEHMQRLADALPNASERAEVYEEIAALSVAMGNDEVAQHASARRDDMLTNASAMEEDSDWSDAVVDDEQPLNGFADETNTARPRDLAHQPDGDKTNAPWATQSPAADAPEIDEFNEIDDIDHIDAGAEIDTTEVKRSEGLDLAEDEVGEESASDKVLRIRAPRPASASEQPDVSAFRREFEASTRRPPPLPELDEVHEDSPLARILRRGTVPAEERVADEPGEPESTEKSEPSTPVDDAPDIDALQEREEAVRDARKSDDHAALADALESLLEATPNDDGRRGELAFELGELLYYDLEDGDRALNWLLEVRRLDPEGYGARTGVLNAIEAIYEERGSVEGRVEILRARLEQAATPDLADTYRLLIAQLEWEDRDDRHAAREWLDQVIERDDRHEGARRLLADIAAEEQEWAESAEHLRVALSVSGDGLDSIELRKRLARLLVDELSRPEDAIKHFRQVLSDAPGDTTAVQGYREALRQLGDWDEYIASLSEELRLLLGQTWDPDAEEDWFLDIDPSSVPEPLRVPASQVLGDIAVVLEEEREDLELAHRVWGATVAIWGEHVEAIERRIDLGRKLKDHEALAADLEKYAEVLLDDGLRFETLMECAGLYASELKDRDKAATLAMKAIRLGESTESVSENAVQEATTQLKNWTDV